MGHGAVAQNPSRQRRAELALIPSHDEQQLAASSRVIHRHISPERLRVAIGDITGLQPLGTDDRLGAPLELLELLERCAGCGRGCLIGIRAWLPFLSVRHRSERLRHPHHRNNHAVLISNHCD